MSYYLNGFKRGLRIPTDFVQDKIEKACQWFQKMTGLTNYWWVGKMAVIIAFVFLARLMLASQGVAINSWWMISVKMGIAGNSLAALMIFVYLSEGAWYWKKKERDAFARLESGLANPRKREYFFRTALLVFSWTSFINLIAFLYFFVEACDPLPPCKGKVREMWEVMHYKLVPLRSRQ